MTLSAKILCQKKRKLAVGDQKKNVEQNCETQGLERLGSRAWNETEDWLSLFGAIVTYQVLHQPLQLLLAIKIRGIGSWKVQKREHKQTTRTKSHTCKYHSLVHLIYWVVLL